MRQWRWRVGELTALLESGNGPSTDVEFTVGLGFLVARLSDKKKGAGFDVEGRKFRGDK